MKKDKSHGQDEADCRAKLILINGDNAPGVVLEAKGKRSTPGEGHHTEPRGLQGCTGLGMSHPLSQALLGEEVLWLWPESPPHDPTGFL